MKKVLYVFVAIIGMLAITSCVDRQPDRRTGHGSGSMLAITSCVDRQQCVGNWVSDSVTDEGFTGKFYLDLRENGTATLNIKGSGAVEEEGMNIKVGVSAKLNGKWDVSMGFMDLELDPDKVKCSIDNISTGNKSVDALIQLFLNDPEAKKQMVEEFKRELNVNDFNGSLEVEFDGDNVMKLTGNDGVVLTFHKV